MTDPDYTKVVGWGPDMVKVLKWVAIVALVVGFTYGIHWVVTTADNKRAHNDRFQGACETWGGTVEGDVCIKDNLVILRKSQVK